MTHAERDLVASYALGALPDDERAAFEDHLASCAVCRSELEDARGVVSALAASVPLVRPSRELRSRLLSTVEAEAELLRAASPRADRPARRRLRLGPLELPSLGALATVAAVVLALVGGLEARELLRRDRVDHRSIALSAPVGGGARARVELAGERTTLRIRHMPPPGSGRVYQVWLQPRSSAAPAATQTLFRVGDDGDAAVELPAQARHAYRLLVSSEPAGGSPTGTPSRVPVVVGSL